MPDYNPNYVVGRGRLYFNRFKDGTNQPLGGELYFGNTPEFTVTTDTETLDHYSSESGMRNMDASVLLEVTQGGNFTCDEINADNLALFFLGEKQSSANTAATDVKEIFNPIQRARYYQLGMTDLNPMGVGNVTNFQMVVADASVSISTGTGDITTLPGVTVVNPTGNYEIDLATGRIYIEPDAPAFAGNMQAAVQYDVEANNRTVVVGKSNMIYGSLRFISDNPVGPNKNYFFPKVSLAPDGDYALKGDDWQVMSFNFNTLKMNNRRERVYIDIIDPNANVSNPEDERNLSASPASTTGVVGTNVAVTVTVRDGNNNVVSGEQVTASSGTGGTVTPASGTTNGSGQVVFQLGRATAGTANLTARLNTGETVTSGLVTFSAT